MALFHVDDEIVEWLERPENPPPLTKLPWIKSRLAAVLHM
jgi:hypothetical protein